MLSNLPPSGRQGVIDLADQAPVVLRHLRELQRLYQIKSDEAARYCELRRRELHDRSGELADLDNRVEDRRAAMDSVGRELADLANKCLDAQTKLDIDALSN